MVVVENIKVSLNKKVIFKNLSFSADKGVLCILGLNGQGKTTILRTLMGLIKTDTGKISLKGVDASLISYKKMAQNLSFVPQEYNNIFNFTVREMVLMGRTPHMKNFNLPRNQDFEITDAAIREIGLSDYSSKYFDELSGGEKRMVLIARALAQQTDIILFDEPTSFLDLKNSYFILEKIKRLSRDKTIIMSLHDLNQTVQYADNVLMLFSQDEFEYGATNEVINEYNLNKLYGLSVEIVRENSEINYIKAKINKN